MSDDDLVRQLRDPPVMSMAMNKGHLYGMMAEKMEAAADRIEELEAKLAEMTQMWLEACDVTDLVGVVVDAEDKLQRAIGALEKVQAFVRDLEPHADQGHTLVPALREACEILAELKGDTDA